MRESYIVNRVLFEKVLVCLANAFPLIVPRTGIIIATNFFPKWTRTTVGENGFERSEDLAEPNILR